MGTTNVDTLAASAIEHGGITQTGAVVGGAHTVTSGEETAGTLDIVTGLSSVTTFIVQIYRSDVSVAEDADVSESSGTLTVADGAATYSVTENDVIHWIAIGS